MPLISVIPTDSGRVECERWRELQFHSIQTWQSLEKLDTVLLSDCTCGYMLVYWLWLYYLQGFRCAIPSVEVRALVWELSWSPRSEKNTLTGWCSHSLSSLHPRFQTQSWSHTMLLSLYTSLWRMLMSAWFLITRLCMTFASEPWSS